jgi:hypothetical protein
VLVHHLERTRDAFVTAADGLSDGQYRFAPATDAWSIAQIVEHLALAELRILEVIGRLPQAPAPSDGKIRGAARFARLDTTVPTRDQRRIVAPEPLVPRGTWASPKTSLTAFVDARAQTIAAATAVDADALEHVLPHRVFGEFDLEEWAYFLGLHSARHTAQVLELKGSAEFPAA